MTDYRLSHGSHATPDEGRCAMEWVSYLAGEPHTDQPVCVSPVLKKFCINFNDALDDETRQRLRPYLARTIGTAGDGLDEQRAWMCADWLIRVFTPTWLDLAGLHSQASNLRSLAAVISPDAVQVAQPALDAARKDAAAARDAAWAAAGVAASAAAGAAARDAASAAAWDAAWDAARVAASAAAGDAAGDAAWDAAWDAARAAAGDAARDAARDAASAAAGDAAGDAAWDAAWDAASAAAGAAARDALQPTVKALQDSAFDLLDRMLPTFPLELPEQITERALEIGVPVGVGAVADESD